MTTRRSLICAGAALAGASALPTHASTGGWETLVYGPAHRRLDAFTDAGRQDWRFVDNALEGAEGAQRQLVTRRSWRDFELRAEVWVDKDATGRLFLRCQDPTAIDEKTACAVNIGEGRAGLGHAVASSTQPVHAAQRWNVCHVRAQGEQVTVTLNGRVIAQTQADRRGAGPVALASSGGTVRFRKVHIREV